MTNIGNPLGNYHWFIGQIPPNWNEISQKSNWNDAHGNRVKVRIPSMHPVSGNDSTSLRDQDLPWAIVSQPTSHGSRNLTSTGIWGGEWVIGFFIDEDKQLPVITQVLGNNLTEYEINESINGTTQGRRVNRFNGGLVSGPHQTIGSRSSSSIFTENDRRFFDRAKT